MPHPGQCQCERNLRAFTIFLKSRNVTKVNTIFDLTITNELSFFLCEFRSKTHPLTVKIFPFCAVEPSSISRNLCPGYIQDSIYSGQAIPTPSFAYKMSFRLQFWQLPSGGGRNIIINLVQVHLIAGHMLGDW